MRTAISPVIFLEVQLSPKLREGKTLNVFNSFLLRKIFVPKGEEV